MRHYDHNLKERVIADYLSGGGTYRQLQGKYGIDFRLIHQWVQAFKDTNTSKKMVSMISAIRFSMAVVAKDVFL